ncbi:MAG: NADH-quinone oxidoreductase subunit L [Phycisphaerae bacterium]|nr:NADH-quinone oxidoreductase subunit L [Gemmatimonadaceae bacterium]
MGFFGAHGLFVIALLPLIGFLINGMFGTSLGGAKISKGLVSAIACGFPLAAFVLTGRIFFSLQAMDYSPIIEQGYRWALIDGHTFDISFYFDRLSAVMTLIVTGVGTAIHVYSTGYMKDDKSYARFMAYLNLFLFFMLLLVLGRSMLVLFVGWEGVGLASYLLIGFWFEDRANAAAGKKAFIVNRIGDAGFLLGMFLLYQAFGTLDMDVLNAAFNSATVPAISATVVGLLLFVGATGKSAQIPLYVWLPDAMAGPTPVSALIHAATMVTAGVYLVARMSGVYTHAPEASHVIALVGVATAFLAATVALVQTDIKKVLAYSTVSQLGFMFLALGVGAYGVAIFHVVTHAFFKACLFLGAGSVIHALGGEQDIRKMGGLARKIPITFGTFLVATAAIAGIPPLAGFFSKDEILWYAFASPSGGSPILWGVAALTALMTAFYMFRLLWLVFFGASRVDHHVEHHIHESPLSMTSVLVVLAILSAGGGALGLAHFLEPQLALPQVPEELHHYETTLVIISVVLAFAGALGAWFVFGGTASRAEALQRTFAAPHRLLTGKYFVDELYAAVFGRPLAWISEHVFLRIGDRKILDGTLNGIGSFGQFASGMLGKVQSGSVHLYALFVMVGIVSALLWSWTRG